MRQRVLGEVELTLLRRDSSGVPAQPSPLTRWHSVPIRAMSPPPRCSGEGPGRRERAVHGAAALAPDDTCELEGLTHTRNCGLSGLEVTGLQVMADMFLPGRVIM